MQVNQTNLRYRDNLKYLKDEDVKFTIIHHTASQNASPNDIHRWHLQRGWSGAGYNELIRKNGSVDIIRGNHIGAHCHGKNHISYGVALEGDFNNEEIQPIQYNVLIDRLKELKMRFKNLIAIDGHKVFNKTSCPGRNISMTKIKMDVDRNKELDWTQILNKVSTNPKEWIKVIQSIKNTNLDMGELNILNYLPLLIEKIYKK